MKKWLLGFISVLCLAMPVYSQNLSKSNYSDKNFERLKNKLADGIRDECIAGAQQDEDYAKVMKETEAYCSCAGDAARKKLSRTDVEKLLTASLTLDEEKTEALFEEVLGAEVDMCLEQSEL